jgi:cyclohexadienyl dehydratase
VLSVGTSGDYAPFSHRAGGVARPSGFDIDLAEAFARDSGRELQLVDFRWPALLRGLAARDFDVAMSGVTVRPDRSLAGRFSVPLARSGAVVLVRAPDAVGGLSALERGAPAIAVNRGGHLERVTRARFPNASVRAIERNQDVLAELLEGRATAIVTDTLEAPHWLARTAGLVALGPFTRDDKAFLIRSDRPELARELDAWLLARERDGTLAKLRVRHFGPGDWPPTATPQAALDAALRERLALMPLVAEAKRRSGAPVEDLERERRVLEAAARSVARSAQARGVEPPDEDGVRRFFEAQIDAAKRVQREVLAAPPDPALEPADLTHEIRPALIRIGDRIALLLVERSLESRGGVVSAKPPASRAQRAVATPGTPPSEAPPSETRGTEPPR